VLTVDLTSDHDLLLRMVRHHAPAVEGVVLELLAYMSLELGSDSEPWQIRQSRVGANSFSLRGRGGEYHFRADHDGQGGIRVYDRAREGNLVDTIATRGEAREFVKGLVSAPVVV